MKLRLASTALDGRTVTLTVMQDGVTVGPLGVNAWGAAPVLPGEGGTASCTVELTFSETTAGVKEVHFKVTGWTGFDTQAGDVPGHDERHHALVYLWDYGDPGSTYEAPVHVLTEWRDANRGYGRYVAHVYDGKGGYDWSCLVIEPDTGKTARISGTVTVADPEVTFGAGRTAYFSPDGDYSDAPGGAIRVSTFEAAVAALRDRPAARIMIARGSTYLCGGLDGSGRPGISDKMNMRSMAATEIHVVAGPGTGARPVIRPAKGPVIVGNLTKTWGNERFQHYVFRDLDCQGYWDPVTEKMTGPHAPTADNPHPWNHDGLQMGNSGGMLVTGCRFSGFNSALAFSNAANQQDRYYCVHDTVVENWQNFGSFFGNCDKIAYLGTRIAQHPYAISGGEKQSGTNNFRHNNHGPVRHDGPYRHDTHMDGCDFFSRTGWSLGFGIHVEQPCFRPNQLMVLGCFHNIQRCAMEGGGSIISFTPVNNTWVPRALDAVIERCILVGSHQTTAVLAAMGTGISFRNNQVVIPDMPRLPGFEPKEFIAVYNHSEATFTTPLNVVNNTFVNQMAAENRGAISCAIVGGSSGLDLSAVLVEENNVVHQPNLASPDVAFAPFDLSPILWAPRALGQLEPGSADPLPTAQASPADTVRLYVPATGSPALGGASSDETTYEDLRGRPRPVHPSAGALEA